MTGTFTSIVITDEKLFVGNGDINKWAHRLEQRLYANMVAEAPAREGELRASIHAHVDHPTSHTIDIGVGTDAPHAMWVLRGTGFPGKGTAGWIYTTKGFVTQNSDDAFVPLWGRRNAQGRFTRLGRGQRQRMMVRKKGFWLGLKPDGPIKFRVHGQRPNNFLYKAYQRTKRTHRELPTAPPSVRNP
jgi:hypothetical protein